MKIKLLTFLTGLFFLSVTTVKVLAGGGPIEFRLEPNTALNPGEQFIVHARVSADGPYPTYCKNCYIKLAFKDSYEGDYIAQNNEKTDEEGRIYAKVISKVSGKRTLIVKDRTIIDSNGNKIEANSSIDLNYTGNSSLPSGNISLFLLNQQLEERDKRSITIKYGWPETDGNIDYHVYQKVDQSDWHIIYPNEKGPSTKFTIFADKDYKFKVRGCIENTNTCAESNELPVLRLSTAPTITPLDAPQMIYPQDGQILDLEGAYMFKVKPVEGSSGYLFGLFQDGAMVYENYRDHRYLSSNGEFAVWESNPFHSKFHEGDVQVWIRAYVRSQWTDARIITVKLKPRGNKNELKTTLPQSSFAPGPTYKPSTALPSIEPSQVVTIIDSSASAALQKRIDELQQKLEESQQRQSALEQRLSEIINWIKSVFPFFK